MVTRRLREPRGWMSITSVSHSARRLSGRIHHSADIFAAPLPPVKAKSWGSLRQQQELWHLTGMKWSLGASEKGAIMRHTATRATRHTLLSCEQSLEKGGPMRAQHDISRRHVLRLAVTVG